MQKETITSRRAAAILSAASLLAFLAASCPANEASFRIHDRFYQTDRPFCGLDSLYACCCASTVSSTTLAALENRAHVGPEGTSMADLIELADSMNIVLEPVNTSLSALCAWGRPAILHVNSSHYIALLYTERDRLVLFDNTIGTFDCDRNWFRSKYRWEGNALILGGTPCLLLRVVQSPVTLIILTCACLGVGLTIALPFKSTRRIAGVSKIPLPPP